MLINLKEIPVYTVYSITHLRKATLFTYDALSSHANMTSIAITSRTLKLRGHFLCIYVGGNHVVSFT